MRSHRFLLWYTTTVEIFSIICSFWHNCFHFLRSVAISLSVVSAKKHITVSIDPSLCHHMHHHNASPVSIFSPHLSTPFYPYHCQHHHFYSLSFYCLHLPVLPTLPSDITPTSINHYRTVKKTNIYCPASPLTLPFTLHFTHIHNESQHGLSVWSYISVSFIIRPSVWPAL